MNDVKLALQPNEVADCRDGLILDAAQRASKYLKGVRERRVAPTPEAVAGLDGLKGEMSDGETAADVVLEMLDAFGSPATVANAGGRYFGFVNGGATPAAMAANVLAAAWDQNTALRVMSPAATVLEDTALRWIRDLLGLPPGSGGSFVSGATMATFTCLAAARQALLAAQGWDVESLGLFDAPPVQVIVSEEVHIAVKKALGLLGLGRDRVLTVPTDSQGRLRVDSIPKITGPTILSIQAGNVNSGSFDPAKDICAAVPKEHTWVHVDGAFGLWAACSPEYARLLEGFSDADSWATDGHKWLNLPYDCGILFVRNAEALHRAMSLEAAYLQAGTEREPMQWGPEMSRRARGVEAWAGLKSLGRAGLAAMIERTCRLAKRFADVLQAAGYEILNDVVINQVLVSFGSDTLTRSVVEAVQRDGTCWCGGTVWHGRYAMRISVCSWATDEHDVDLSLAAFIRIARECKEESKFASPIDARP